VVVDCDSDDALAIAEEQRWRRGAKGGGLLKARFNPLDAIRPSRWQGRTTARHQPA
jgi:hypothetical protein